MHLRIMTERLKMPDSFYGIPYGFLIDNISCIKCYLCMKTLFYQALQNLYLHRPHELRIDFP